MHHFFKGQFFERVMDIIDLCTKINGLKILLLCGQQVIFQKEPGFLKEPVFLDFFFERLAFKVQNFFKGPDFFLKMCHYIF